MRNSVTIVPFFDSLGLDALAFVINQTELITMCIEKTQFEHLIKLKKDRTPTLKNIVMFDDSTQEQRDKAKEVGLTVYDFTEVLRIGTEHPEVVLRDPTPKTVYMFCYTSGTTGDPKGAKMLHEMFLACHSLVIHARMDFNENDVSISYLPMAHIFE
jgi:long-chain acyl-CoA synthetase